MHTPKRRPTRRARIMLSLALAAVGVPAVMTTPAASAAPTTATPSARDVVGLRYGSRGPAVKELQRALIRAGVGVVGGADGIFGPATQSSVKAFQRIKGLQATGVVNTATARALGLISAPTPLQQGVVGLHLGSQGRAVTLVQQALIRHGITVFGGADGIFGFATQRALISFQRARGLDGTGVVSLATARSLGLTTPTTPTTPTPTGFIGIRIGMRGDLVRRVQQALLNAGITVPGGADGIFGPATQAAVKRFQAAKGLEQTGEIGPRTAAALRLTGPAPIPSPTPANKYIGLRLGSRGDAVKDVQRAIMATGMYLAGGADGIFGLATQNALMIFQRTNGLIVTGMVNPATVKLMGLEDSPSTPPTTPTPGETPDGFPRFDERGPRVVALQQALIRAGIPVPGGADGVFGSATAGAIMKFQQRKGLPVTGRVDAATARALGLTARPRPTTPTPVSVRIDAKPVEAPCWYGDTWLAPRGGGRVHLGVDILAARGNSVYAVVDGTVTQIYRDFPGSLAGNGVKITKADGTYFFYAHFDRIRRGIGVGSRVGAGQQVGTIGSTGNTVTPHLHFEVHPNGGSAVNPYPIVKARGAC
ncbi:MAG: peptidoglycan-binding protein [Acidimicrobiia bacterium]|nr:peptidoglycan-binding protein [Acidimicrobiia bacterium]